MSGRSTVPEVTDLVLTGIKAHLDDKTILVSDGYPGATRPTVIVAVGGTGEAVATGRQNWAYLGAKTREENYDLLITTSVSIGGDGQDAETPGADAMKAARDLAYEVVHVIEEFFVADPTLGNYFTTGARRGGWVGIQDTQLLETGLSSVAVQQKLHVYALI